MPDVKAKSTGKKIKLAFKDIDREIVKDDEIVVDTIDAKTQRRIVAQVEKEYQLSFKYSEAKRAVQLARLRLYNNQRRKQETIGDPLMFTVFNTILAALYDDRLMHSWEGRGGEGDEDVEENLNALATYDYDIMDKSELDYYWDWDSCFFGRGLMLMLDFDRTDGMMTPRPELLDPVTFIRDINAKSVNGYGPSGAGAMRFGGWQVGASYYELKNKKGYFNIESLRKGKDSLHSLLERDREARDLAQNRTRFDPDQEGLDKFGNYEFTLLNWFTHIKGRKYLVTLGNERTTLVRLLDVDKYNGDWPLIDRTLYPMAHDWDGVSIPDITEDKQRARAVLLNLGLISAKTDTMPQYLYDQTRIKNKNDLNWRTNKFIGVDGRVDNAIQPVQKSTVHQYVNVIMDMLDVAAQRATATPEIQQGVVSNEKRTLGEIELVSSKVDTRYSMNAKIFGWSERKFWRQWYKQYKVHMKDKIDEKIVRVSGILAPSWRTMTRENIISKKDPDVRIESKVISEAKRIREQQGFAAFATLALQDPNVNRGFIQRKNAKLNGMSKEEIDIAFPPTVDESKAQDENISLNDNEVVEIDVLEDHVVHIQEHAKANDTLATMVHIKAHRTAELAKRANPELITPPPEAGVEPVNDARTTAQLPVPSTPTQ